MKNKLLVFLALLIMVVLTLTACKSEPITITDEISQYIMENELNVDAAGNPYAYTVEIDAKTNKVVVSIESVSVEAKEALENTYGDLVEVVELKDKVLLQNGLGNSIENEPTEEKLDKLRKELGLKSSESKFFENPLFHGEFGHSIDLRFLMIVLILLFTVIFGIIYLKKKRK